jgi:tetratricopeptide (TPR) repeat protein
MASLIGLSKKGPLLILVIWSLLILGGAGAVKAQPQFCTDEIFPPLTRGFEALRAGNDDLARLEFEKVIKIDPFNPYALNNLGVLAEKRGKLKEAMAYLLDAETYAAEYLHKTEELCEAGGLCLAVAPATEKSKVSSIASLIHSNINLLRGKIGKANN